MPLLAFMGSATPVPCAVQPPPTGHRHRACKAHVPWAFCGEAATSWART